MRPTLDYCSCVWDPHTQWAAQKLKSVGLPDIASTDTITPPTSVTNMLNLLNWQTLHVTRKEKDFKADHALQDRKWSCGHIISLMHTSNYPTKIRKLPCTPLGFQPYQTNIDTFKYSFFPRTITT